MYNILVIIKKELRDTVKNKTILIQFILFPLLTLIMENAISIEGMEEFFFIKLFAVMYIGMAPLTAMASVISEEKEKNTLRVLMMADIKPWQYICGVGVYVWSICMLGAAVMGMLLPSSNRLFFLVVMGLGFVISILAGACVGIFSKNQMVATSLTMPVMMIFSFVPMLSMFNESIKKVSTIIFTQQLKLLFDSMSFAGCQKTGVSILCINAVMCAALFFMMYRKKGLE
ncbi:ABC transporter permease [Butyrivibrio sp. VCD2006]|uniref:ABC transporter permease n=1 Tax=Butyrivibrio sp. VCD2006 TaxID=1280664 RepID=UPI0004231DA7|nr:ABC transporter permease [Butyrivibrio sp. VCD2006]